MTDKQLNTRIESDQLVCRLGLGLVFLLTLTTGINTLISHIFTAGIAFTLLLSYIGFIILLLRAIVSENEKRFRMLEKHEN